MSPLLKSINKYKYVRIINKAKNSILLEKKHKEN